MNTSEKKSVFGAAVGVTGVGTLALAAFFGLQANSENTDAQGAHNTVQALAMQGRSDHEGQKQSQQFNQDFHYDAHIAEELAIGGAFLLSCSGALLYFRRGQGELGSTTDIQKP